MSDILIDDFICENPLTDTKNQTTGFRQYYRADNGEMGDKKQEYVVVADFEVPEGKKTACGVITGLKIFKEVSP